VSAGLLGASGTPCPAAPADNLAIPNHRRNLLRVKRIALAPNLATDRKVD
jgi:hypothetical protein